MPVESGMRVNPCANLVLAALAIGHDAAAALGRAMDFPALTEEHRARLMQARDGGDHQEPAFFILLRSAAGFDGEVGDAPIRLAPDLDAMIERPADFRGDLCRVTGIIQQRTDLSGRYVGAVEWFLRDDAARPFIVYVARVDETRHPLSGFHDGQRVEIVARFYKRMDAAARDGRERSYAAFVGARPRIVLPAAGGPGSGAAMFWVVAIPAAVLLGVFLILVVYARRHREPGVRRRRFAGGAAAGDVAALDLDHPLSDDPAEALGELHERAHHVVDGAAPPESSHPGSS